MDESKVRKAVEVANELSKTKPPEIEQLIWSQVFNALLSEPYDHCTASEVAAVEHFKQSILTWLGAYRDHLPQQAVGVLQDILGVPTTVALDGICYAVEELK